VSRHGALEDERGFTLFEVIATIIIMGIVFAIASSTWFKVAESRRVDSATNQVVADLRLAHTQATNRLTDSSFVVPSADSSTYQIGPPGDLDTMTLPGDDQGTPKTKILDATNIVFKSDGRAITPPDPPGDPPEDITVTTTDGDPGDPVHTININTVTSRVKVVN
jgi:prepilin-type N-terminal cleavage/methylation domain-containing protein